MSNSIVSQIPKNLLFHYQIPCHPMAPGATVDTELDVAHQLPHFGQFEGQSGFADVRLGWNHAGLLLSVDVVGKRQTCWCRQTDLLESDGIQLWLDTRNTNNVHRASKFCHWFVFLPIGGGPQNTAPISTMLKINRSREDSPTINRERCAVKVTVNQDGYRLQAMIPGSTLHGWDPDNIRKLGFNYAIVDRELGWQSLAIGPELPIQEDPSLWQSVALVD